MIEQLGGGSYEMERPDPDRVLIGDLVYLNDAEHAGVHPKFRVLAITEGASEEERTVWVGDPSLSPRDVDEFQRKFFRGEPLDEKFAHVSTFDSSRLSKLLDS